MILQTIIQNSQKKQKTKNFNLPLVSISQLQKDYIQKKKRKHISSNSEINNLNHFQQIHIRSPFYDRNTCNKTKCKCQYHKKIKITPVKSTGLLNNKQYKKNYGRGYIMKTQQDQGYKQQKQSNIQSQKNFKYKLRLLSVPDQSIQQNMRGQKQKKSIVKQQIINTWKTYQNQIKNIKKQGAYQIDCRNYQYEQFLRNNNLVILQNNKETYNSRKSMFNQNNEIYKIQNNKRKSFMYENKDKNKKIIQLSQLNKSRIKSKQNNKKSIKTLNSCRQQRQNYSQSKYVDISKLNNQEQNYLQKFLKQMLSQLGIKRQNIIEGNLINHKQNKFFQLICNKLMEKDLKQIQLAQNLLSRISSLPLSIFDIIFQLIRNQIDSGLQLKIDSKPQDIQKVVKTSIMFIQKNIQEMIKLAKQKQGKQKIKIINNMKNKYTGRKSLNFYHLLQTKRLKTLSQINQNQSSINSTLLFNNKGQIINSDIEQINQDQDQQQYQQSNLYKISKKSKINQFQQNFQRQNSKILKKGNFKKKKENKKIIQKIEQQISKDKIQVKILKPQIIQKKQDEYLKQINDNLKKKIEKQNIQNFQFAEQMKRKNKQRKSSHLSQYQIQKNTVRAHYQRNKNFIQKIQVTLNDNHLKEVVINLQDNILTKKRKLRILKKLLQNQDQTSNSDFSNNLKKYVQIFDKNCQLQLNKKGNNKFAKRRVFTQKFFDYQVNNENQQNQPLFEDQFMKLILLDKNLKFYNLRNIDLQQQDNESLVLKISSSITKKKKVLNRHKNIWLPKNLNQILKLNYQNEQSLIQIGLQANCQISIFQQHMDELKIQLQKQLQKQNHMQLSEFEEMKQKFNKKIKEYRENILRNKQYKNDNTLSIVK